MSLDWLVQKLIVINRRGNFVHHDWGGIQIYRPLSYLFRFLPKDTHTKKRKRESFRVNLQFALLFITIGRIICMVKETQLLLY